MKNIITVLILSISLLSCHPQGREYVEHKELSPVLEWLKKDVIEFKVPIEQDNLAFDMRLAFRYVVGYEHESLKVKVTETSPSGKIEAKEYELQLIDKDGKYIGDPALSFIDSEHLIEANKLFKEKGVYTYQLEQIMPNDPLNYAMEIGVILDQVQ